MPLPADTAGWRRLEVAVVRDFEPVMERLGFADRWVPIEVLVGVFDGFLTPGQMRNDLSKLVAGGVLERRIGFPRVRRRSPARPWRTLYRTAEWCEVEPAGVLFHDPWCPRCGRWQEDGKL